MPDIRDYSWTYNTVTTATSITIPMPTYQTGDLLVAILSTDTGTQTWSCSGWTILFSQTNTVNLAFAYKIASSSEPSSYTFTYTTAETANGCIISIRDVDTVSPIANNIRINFTSARQAMPTTTVTRVNSLILYVAAHVSTAVIPSIIEGSVTFLYSSDGSAHSDAVSWGFQTVTGSTPNNIYITVTGTTYTGVLATVVINPPSTGATVIPVHCAGDNCQYVDPIHGTTAFRGNTAFAGTATTYWTNALIANRTLANATVSAKTDYGINTFRTCGGMTGPTTTNTYTGATLVLADANRIDIRGKNVLVHAMPLVPADIQTVYDAGMGKGIDFGIASSANNGIVWHVHGANTPFGINRVPIIVNPDNTSGRIDIRGNPDFSLAKIFGFFTCGFLISSDWVWTTIWVMEDTIVCGGTSIEPMTIPKLVNIVSIGHERISALLQGAGQCILYQAIQIGNGGINPTYLNLDSTAIEFPEIYNLQKRLTQYCSVPNAIGITYYAGNNDTIIHRNSVISSASPYYWRIHASSSISATYDFNGLQIIGAGDIQLKQGILFNGITFQNCAEIAVNGATMQNCVFTNSAGIGAIYINNPSDITNISNCIFKNNSSYAIRLMSSTAQTYTFNNLKFENNTKDVYIAATSGTVTINIINGGSTPTYISAGATVIINNLKTLTLDNIPLHSKVRILESGTTNILDGTDNSSTTFIYNYNYGDIYAVDIVIVNLQYKYYKLSNVILLNSDMFIPISMEIDRWYNNP